MKIGIISQANYAAFATKIGGYKENIALHVIDEQVENGENLSEVNINTTDPDEIKKILGDNIEEGDESKYVIQNNELRYNPDTVTDQEEEWLIQLGILAMTSMFLLTFMVNGSVYQTIQADKITFPEVNPTSTEGNFAGWYYDQELNNQAIEGEEVTSDLTLYPKWENFKITFIFNGEVYSEISNDENKVIYPETPKHPQGEGFTFTGWYDGENGKYSISNGTVVTKDTVLYPGWKVEFNGYIPYIRYSPEEVKEFLITLQLEELSTDELTILLKTINETFELNLTTEEIGLFIEAIKSNMFEITDEMALEFVEKFMNYYIQNKNSYNINASTLNLYFLYNEKENITKYELINASVFTKDAYDQNKEYDISKNVSVNDKGVIIIDGEEYGAYYLRGNIKIKVIYNNGKEDIIVIDFDQEFLCLAEGTKITLADMSKKNIEDIEYSDELLVWDFDNGCFAKAKPLWIKKAQVAEEYNLVKFDDGAELKTVADHRIFNMEAQRFTYTMDEEETPLGTSVFKEDGSVTKIVERSVVKEKVNYYNIITNYHMNLFANGLLTSLRLNNLYKIENMKFVKDNRELIQKEEFKGIPDKYIKGLRLAEQPRKINRGNDVKHTKTLQEYVKRLLPMEK